MHLLIYLFTPAFLCHITHFTFSPHKNAPCLLQEASLLVNLDIFCSVIADLQTMPPYNPTHLIFKLAGFVKFVRYSSIQIFQMFSGKRIRQHPREAQCSCSFFLYVIVVFYIPKADCNRFRFGAIYIFFSKTT